MVSREELYELVWSMPMTKVAERFDVSGSYLARVCSTLHVPRPERGYWAKLAVGKAPERPPLPELEPGDQLSWSPDGELQPSAPLRLALPQRPPRPRLPRPITSVHGLIRVAKGHYEAGYNVDEGQLLRPYKRLLVDVTASAAGLDKALAFANDLFNALESVGHRVLISSSNEQFRREHIEAHEQQPKAQRQEYPYADNHLWWPCRPTVVYVDTVAFGLAVIEMTEAVVMRYLNGKYIRDSEYAPSKASVRYANHTWTTTKDIPCGRLRLLVYSPYSGAAWSMSFQESKIRTLTQDISKIVKSIENSTEALVEKIKEAERQAEIARQIRQAEMERWEREEDRRREAQSRKESHEQLDQVIQAWANAVSLEQFFQGVQDRADDLPEEQRKEVMNRLQLARDFVGTQDPLDFFLSWRTPIERYIPLSTRMSSRLR